MAAEAHGQKHYIKIWAILTGLLVVSIIGPELGNPIVTLITAFGIAIVKAYLVAKNFMHLNLEKRWVSYTLVAMLAFVALFIAGVSSDVMMHEGKRWENVSAKQVTKQRLEEQAAKKGTESKH